MEVSKLLKPFEIDGGDVSIADFFVADNSHLWARFGH
jgi:hypothetical protein